jgi:hypothetical protein
VKPKGEKGNLLETHLPDSAQYTPISRGVLRQKIGPEKIMTENLHSLPRLSVEARLRDLQYELRVSSAFVATLGSVLPQTLSNAYRGIRALDNLVGQELLADVTFLMQCSEALRPFEFPVRNAQETRELIDRLRKSGVTPETVRAGIQKILAGKE